MSFLFPKPSMPRSDQVLPGRAEAIVQPGAQRRERPRAHAALSGRIRGGRLRDGLLLGRREGVLDDSGRVGHRRRLPGRFDAQPDLQRGLHRPHRPCRGRARGLRPVGRVLRAPAEAFWEHHDPTQGIRQGNDVGTQYRSAIYTHGPAQLAAAEASRDMYAAELAKDGYHAITTEIREAPTFYFAEDYHQQYLVEESRTATARPLDRRQAAGRFPRHSAAVRGLTARGASGPAAGRG